jgi:hypothetical protein
MDFSKPMLAAIVSRPFNPLLPVMTLFSDILHDRFPDHLPEHPVKMKFRNISPDGQMRQAYFFR